MPGPLSDGRGLAHDAGNLLGALGLYCELLARPGVLRDEHRHYAAELGLLSGRSRDLIDRLLNPATTGRRLSVMPELVQVGDKEQVVVPDVIEGCRGLLNAVARRAVAVAYEAGSALPVAISREALERILVNLTKNAAEAIDVGCDRSILLRVVHQQEEGAERIVLTIEDRGKGMSKAAVKVLMSEPRSISAKEGARGIGFQVVRELVGASGGQLRLRSTDCGEASGTTVEIAWSVATLVRRCGELAFEDTSTSPTERLAFVVPAQTESRNGSGGTAC
ncbi:ATP-binding protein [Granulicella arctica]|uniref:ATP-binding protein n=1 Tax=Granulicella arctica TaxID=940613 RepID=UPI0021E013EC|nr:ATP-binding protein [Granulicella arctica]